MIMIVRVIHLNYRNRYREETIRTYRDKYREMIELIGLQTINNTKMKKSIQTQKWKRALS